MSINGYPQPTPEEIAAMQARSRAEAIVVLARAVLLAALQGEGLATGYEGASDEELKGADEANARAVRASFDTAREFYRLAAETLKEAVKT